MNGRGFVAPKWPDGNTRNNKKDINISHAQWRKYQSYILLSLLEC
jgi:hypothetical protein